VWQHKTYMLITTHSDVLPAILPFYNKKLIWQKSDLATCWAQDVQNPLSGRKSICQPLNTNTSIHNTVSDAV